MYRLTPQHRRGTSVWALSPLMIVAVLTVIGTSSMGLRSRAAVDSNHATNLERAITEIGVPVVDEPVLTSIGMDDSETPMDNRSSWFHDSFTEREVARPSYDVAPLVRPRWLDQPLEIHALNADSLPHEREGQELWSKAARRGLDEESLGILSEREAEAARDRLFHSPATRPQFGRTW